MTREIKFRGWDEKHKKMFYLFDSNISTLHGSSNITFYYNVKNIKYKWRFLESNEYSHCSPVFYSCTDENSVLMQYTGLKDKNGKEIYESDIIYGGEYTGRHHVVVWSKDDLQFQTKEGYLIRSPYANKSIPWEVIGNIYENPELLEKR